MPQAKSNISSKRIVCVHGHFYQPPRENPWLEEIELQYSAYPYRDWNRRIVAECYDPNASSRMIDEKGRIIDIVNNYANISFNFGPTLLGWMERFQPEIYKAILDADKLSMEKFSGHGAALAQCYNHIIMPLCNDKDKRTQVIWGIKDFESRFKRSPEGMWLPETAVDLSTLEVLAEYNIAFTILAPHQAKRFKKLQDKEWQEAKEGEFETKIPYRCKLPSGREIVIFFYDGPISHDIAFGGLLNSGEGLANRLLSAFPQDHKESLLVHVATDGETFGHHHRFGEMALSYCLNYIESKGFAQIGIYSQFLSKNPPKHEVEINERSSWSCAHGVERWRLNCGCRVGGNNWNQEWRKPLRIAMDWLRDELRSIYETQIQPFCEKPWSVRDEYIYVLLDRGIENTQGFLNRIAVKELSQEEKVKILKLLEMQKYAMFMYTSCGWFFDDISGIESIQILQYAARAIQLAREVSRINLEDDFVKRLEEAKSNVAEHKNGAFIYKKFIKPHIIDLLKVGAHYAISSLFEEYPESVEVYSFNVHVKDYQLYEFGRQKLVIGKALIRSMITWEERLIDFAAMHFGDYNLNGGVRYNICDDDYDLMHTRLKEMFEHNNIPEVIHLMNEYFGTHTYSLWDLFKNEQGKVLSQVFDNTLGSIEAHFREIYEHYYPLMHVNPDFRIPLPKALSMTVEFVLTRDIMDTLDEEDVDIPKLEKLVKEMKRWSFTRDKDSLSYKASQKINELMHLFFDKPVETKYMQKIKEVLKTLKILKLGLNMRETQNVYFSMLKDIYPRRKAEVAKGNENAREWISLFEELGDFIKVKTT